MPLLRVPLNDTRDTHAMVPVQNQLLQRLPSPLRAHLLHRCEPFEMHLSDELSERGKGGGAYELHSDGFSLPHAAPVASR